MELKEHIKLLNEDIDKMVSLVEEEFLHLDLDVLNWKKSESSWSILECIEHLNRYSFYYLNRIKHEIPELKVEKHNNPIKFSWFGKKNVNIVRPGNLKKYKAIPRMNPNNSELNKDVFTDFFNFQKMLQDFIAQLSTTKQNRRKIRIEAIRLVKMGIGETIVFLVEHQKRHLRQALTTEEKYYKYQRSGEAQAS